MPPEKVGWEQQETASMETASTGSWAGLHRRLWSSWFVAEIIKELEHFLNEVVQLKHKICWFLARGFVWALSCVLDGRWQGKGERSRGWLGRIHHIVEGVAAVACHHSVPQLLLSDGSWCPKTSPWRVWHPCKSPDSHCRAVGRGV